MADMTNILQTIAARTRERVTERKEVRPLADVADAARALAENELSTSGSFAFPFEEALRRPGMSFICETKKASPSKGVIAEDFPYLQIARDYEAAGAAAISCLTEPYWFLGSDEYLRAIAQEVSIPVLRKDFVVDEYMVYEAKTLGAAAVLLIVAILDDERLRSCVDLAHELGMSALVEAYSEDEVPRALAAGARVVGVNNRDLRSFSVDFENSTRLRGLVGADRLFVSESGVRTRDDIARLEEAHVDAVLIGETLMRAEDKAAMLAELRGDAR